MYNISDAPVWSGYGVPSRPLCAVWSRVFQQLQRSQQVNNSQISNEFPVSPNLVPFGFFYNVELSTKKYTE